MQVTFPPKQADIAELTIDGESIKYRIPPAIGTHSQVFQALSVDESLETAQGMQIVAYAHGCLQYKQNEWANQDTVRFPNVLTVIPKKPQFGDLEGGMLVDPDLEGQGIEMITEVPQDLTGWEESDGGILKKGNRLFLPYDTWYKDQWNQTNGAVIALCTPEGGEFLEKTSTDTKRTYRPLWKVDPDQITSPEKRVPVLSGGDAAWLGLSCGDLGSDRSGCGLGVLK